MKFTELSRLFDSQGFGVDTRVDPYDRGYGLGSTHGVDPYVPADQTSVAAEHDCPV